MGEKKICLMFKRKDGSGVQCVGHSACIFLLLSAREAGIPGAHSFNKYLLRDFFVLVSMPGALITQFLPAAGSLGSKWNSDQVVQAKGFRII